MWSFFFSLLLSRSLAAIIKKLSNNTFLLDARNSNGSSCSIDLQLFELFVYEKLLSEFQLGRPCGCSIDISLIRAVSRKIVRRSLQGSHNPRLSWQRTRTKKETSLEAIGQEKYKVTLFTCRLGWVLSDERFC